VLDFKKKPPGDEPKKWVILSSKIMFLQLRDLNYMSQLVPIDGNPGVLMWPLGSLIRSFFGTCNFDGSARSGALSSGRRGSGGSILLKRLRGPEET
jgi:hypothetical protein